MRRIAVYLESSGIRGGIEIFAERQIAELRAEGCEVDVFGAIPEGDDPFAEYDELIVHKAKDVATLERFPANKTVFYVHDHEPICPRSYAYTPLGRNCTRPGGFWPCIFCAPLCRSWKAALSRVMSQSRRIRAMSEFKRIVVISKFMKSRLAANSIPEEIIEVKPPAIDVSSLGGASGVGDPDVPERIDVLFAGQLIRGKGVQLLLKAMALSSRPWTLDVIGTGNMEGKLRQLAARLGLEGRVRWRGFRARPQDWMAKAACVVVPSFWQEPYGLVAAEAVALGRKVVAFAVGGLPEACQGRAELVPAGDYRALAAKIDSVLAIPS